MSVVRTPVSAAPLDEVNVARSGSLPTPNQVFIEKRESWTDEWVWDPELWPASAEVVAGSQGNGRCVFRRRYGPQVKTWFGTSFTKLDKYPDLTGWWIRVSVYINTVAQVLFVGRVQAPQEDIAGDQVEDLDHGTPTKRPMGVQTWVAAGPLAELERSKITQAYWLRDNDDGTTSSYRLDWLPDFNMLHGDPGLSGNRSDDTTDKGGTNALETFVFGGTDKWTGYDILVYTLRRYGTQPTRDPDTDEQLGPMWFWGGDSVYLDGSVSNPYQPRIQLRSVENARALLRLIMPAERGIDFSVEYVEAAGLDPDGFRVNVFGLWGDELPFEGYKNLQNLNVTDFPASEDRRLEVSIEHGGREKYDRVRLVGDRIISVLTVASSVLGLSNIAGRINWGWTTQEMIDYNAGDPTPGASAEDHARFRADERFRNVYQRYMVPADIAQFDWQGGLANPVFSPNGDGTHAPDTQNLFQWFEMGTLPRLPLVAGVDYTVVPPVNRTLTTASPPYLTPIVLTNRVGSTAPRWFQVDKLRNALLGERAVSVAALEHELGVLLDGSPNHVMGYGWMGQPPQHPADDFNPLFGFWPYIAATLAVETDNRIFIAADLPDDIQAGDGSVKDISVPLAQFWWLSPYAVVGIGANNALLRAPAGGIELRNDIELLKAMMPGVLARFSYQRHRAQIVRKNQIEAWNTLLGGMLRLKGEQQTLDLRVPVTGVKWDFERLATSLYAGHAERAGAKDVPSVVSPQVGKQSAHGTSEIRNVSAKAERARGG